MAYETLTDLGVQPLNSRWCSAAPLPLSFSNEVLELLRQFGLDERAIEAEAIKSSSADLIATDKMLTLLLEATRRQALRSIAQYRDELAERLEHRSDLILDQENLVQLERRS